MIAALAKLLLSNRLHTLGVPVLLLLLAASPLPPQSKVAEGGASVSAALPQKSAPLTSTDGGRSASGTGLVSVLLALGIVIVIILGLRWTAGKLLGGGNTAKASRAVKVLARCPITPRQQILLVQLGERILVLAGGGSGLSMLCQITDAQEISSLVGKLGAERADSISSTFASLFGHAAGKFQAHEELPTASPLENDRQPAPDDAAFDGARRELAGLKDRMRLLVRQFKG